MATSKVSLSEVVGLDRYERERPEFRARIIALKKRRRVAVGDRVTLVFENHDTMLFQIQEMLRAEHIVDLDKIRDEIEVYNALVPSPGELSATLLIEITDSDRIREDLVQLIGIDECVSMQIGTEHRIPAEFEPGRSKEDKLSAVQYVRFKFNAAQRAAFLEGADPIRLVVEHKNYRHAADVERAVWESLREDLE